MRFETKEYFDKEGVPAFYPFVEIVFTVAAQEHYHIPLLLNPFGYSTYRGSWNEEHKQHKAARRAQRFNKHTMNEEEIIKTILDEAIRIHESIGPECLRTLIKPV